MHSIGICIGTYFTSFIQTLRLCLCIEKELICILFDYRSHEYSAKLPYCVCVCFDLFHTEIPPIVLQ